MPNAGLTGRAGQAVLWSTGVRYRWGAATTRASATTIALNASDPDEAARLRFPGSPTVRVDGRDVDPAYLDPGDYTPRCGLYWTAQGLRGVPERAWIESALRAAVDESIAESGQDT